MNINEFVHNNFHVLNNPSHGIGETDLFVLCDLHVPPFAMVHNQFIDTFGNPAESRVYVESHEPEKVVDSNCCDTTLFLERNFEVIGWDSRAAKTKEISEQLPSKVKQLSDSNTQLIRGFHQTKMKGAEFAKKFDDSIMEIGKEMSNESIQAMKEHSENTFLQGSEAISKAIEEHKPTKRSFDFLIAGAFHFKECLEKNCNLFAERAISVDLIKTNSRVTVLFSKILGGTIPEGPD